MAGPRNAIRRGLAATVIIPIACAVLALALSAAAQFPRQPTKPIRKVDYLDQLLTVEQQRRCGLQRLAQAERKQLDEHLKKAMISLAQKVVASSGMATDAEAYLRNEGWEPIHVIGTARIRTSEFDEWGTEVLIVEGLFGRSYYGGRFGGDIGIIDKIKLRSGYHLGKSSVFSLELIGTDGTVIRLSQIEPLERF